MRTTLLYAALATASGLLTPIMAARNRGLGKLLGHPVWAGVVLAQLVSAAAIDRFGPFGGPPARTATAGRDRADARRPRAVPMATLAGAPAASGR